MRQHWSDVIIGVDARLLARPLTGVGRYTLELCREMAKIPSVKLYLYSPSPIRYNIQQAVFPVVSRVGTCFNNKFLEQIWFEVLLPFYIQRDNLDIFWGPAHRLPIRILSNAAYVVTIHDLVWKYAPETMRLSVRILEGIRMPAAIRRAAHIVVDSQCTRDSLVRGFNLDQKKITTIPLSHTPQDKIAPISILNNLQITKPYFLFVGTLEPRKNLIRLLKAFALIDSSLHDKIIMVIVGGKGWSGQHLVECFSSLLLEDRIRVVGYVDDFILGRLYKEAQFLAMPSLYEGFGLPILEAMSYGIPVLTTKGSAMSEIAENCGIFIDAEDISSIRHGLEIMISDELLRKKLARNALIDSLKFSWEKSAVQLVSVFNKFLVKKKEVCL